MIIRTSMQWCMYMMMVIWIMADLVVGGDY